MDNNFKYLKLLATQYPSISKASTEIINLEAILNLPKGTEHFISDIHGEHQAFGHVLRNGSGVIKRKIDELFSSSMREKEKRVLATLVYYPEEKLEKIIKEEKENINDFYRINMYRLIELCKYTSRKYTRSKVRKLLPNDFRYIIEELLHEDADGKHKQEYYQSIIETIIDIGRAENFIIAISKTIQKLVIDRLHIVGDIYDRGPRPDKVVDTLMDYHSVDIQWGNHDILWMGAASGEKTCIANALRISARYANLDIIEDIYGINLLPLATFALDIYKDDECSEFLPKTDSEDFTSTEKSLIAKMHKAISIIQFKLEGEIIKRRPEFELDHRLVLEKIDYDNGCININNKEYKLLDSNFPTIDKNNPYTLTREEEILIDKLVSSFKNSDKLQKHVSFLYSKGSIYLVSNSNLLIHACVPIDKNGEFLKMNIQGKNYSGKSLMDKMESLSREGYFLKDDTNQKQYGMDITWYLWTGKCSALFGKDYMTTFERYFIKEKETHKENKNPYFKMRENLEIIQKIFDEFDLDINSSHIISGHVPVESKKGESPIKGCGKVLIIDGGFSKAYHNKTGIAGYTLISNSHSLQLVSHKPFSSQEEAIENEEDILSTTMIVENGVNKKKVRDTEIGREIKKEIDDLKDLLKAYRKGIIKEGNNTI